MRVCVAHHYDSSISTNCSAVLSFPLVIYKGPLFCHNPVLSLPKPISVMPPQHFTPWQTMKGFAHQMRKLEENWRTKLPKKGAGKEEEGVIIAEPLQTSCPPLLTYFNNGKSNDCCKTAYEYNFSYCDGYDQHRPREDRKHAARYLNTDLEEEYPIRTIPLRTSSNYGHRPSIARPETLPKNHAVKVFYRPGGTKYCMDANGVAAVKLNPPTSFQWNSQYGYTYSPPRS